MVMNRITKISREIFIKWESHFLYCFFGTPPPQGICVSYINETSLNPTNGSTVLDIFRNPFLFAVPKTRRTVEKRKNRKFGFPDYHWKPLVPKRNILMCDACGNDYQAGHLCGYCYKRVKLETEEMQKAIQAELQLNPVDKEVTVLYEGDAIDKPEHFWKGKRIVEMKKPRPSWFSKNLLQKSTNDNSSEDKNIKPVDLA